VQKAKDFGFWVAKFKKKKRGLFQYPENGFIVNTWKTAVLVQLEVIFSLELPHMKTQSSISLHFLGYDCYCLQISVRA